MVGDLHIHSTLSDGTLSVREILVLAKERGLSFISIADQNVTTGTAEAIETGARIGLTVVPGVEIPARHAASGTEVHILGYGYRLPATSINELSHKSVPVLASDVIRRIHEDGGRAVLAHPGQLDSYGSVEDLVQAGLDGIEIYHPDHGPEDHRRVQLLAARFGLFLTGGSDGGGRHGGGTGIGDIRAPHGSLEYLVKPDNEILSWAEGLVRQAGAMARRAVLSEIETELKGGNISDIVTEHDMAIDRFLTNSIRQRFPDHGFLTEEYDHPSFDDDTPAWIIDPIDGTTNFVSSHSGFAVSLAHYRGTCPVFGFVYDVMADELYVGISGGGAWMNGRRLTVHPKPPHDSVAEISLLCSKRLEKRFGADTTALTRDLRAVRSYGSAAIGVCRIAAGTLDIYLSCSLSPWDYAAALIVLAEAGGRAAVENGEPAGREAVTLTPGSRSIIFEDGRRVFMAATTVDLLDGMMGRVFPGPKRPAMVLLAPA